jgi:hypothetical protein
MIFIEKLFENYFREYIKSAGIRGGSKIEEEYIAVLAKWKNTPIDGLDGLTPTQYLDALLKRGELADYISELCKAGIKIGDVTVEFINRTERRTLPGVMLRLFEKGNKAARIFAVERLGNVLDDGVTNFLSDIIINSRDYDKEVADAAFDALKDGREGLDFILLAKTDNLESVADEDSLDMLLDILSGYAPNAFVKGRVTQGFLSGEKRLFYVNLLGRCGDDESVGLLKDFLKSNEATKHEYIEIRNAVERLGGSVE